MNASKSLPRKILSNPNTGRHGSHPLPHPSELSSFDPDSSSELAMQTQVDQAINQLISSETDSPSPSNTIHSHADPQSNPKISETKKEPVKPTKPVMPPPKTYQTHSHPKLNQNIAPAAIETIAEIPRIKLSANDEVQEIKNLKSFKIILLGTTLFILGIFVSAFLAIFLNFI